tara:strand:- start:619 stop:867 length:249 start_codon:yes stop_codon:yes gene_type:complete
MEYAWYDFVGNLGVLCVLGTYLSLQMGRLALNGLMYSLINGVGALLILVSLFFNFNLSSVTIEVVWLLISAYGIVKHLRNRP